MTPADPPADPPADAVEPQQDAQLRARGLVLLAGVATSAVTLLGLWWVNHNYPDANPTNFYMMFVVPIGAILAGAVAGSGYGLASWLTGVKISRGLLVSVVLLMAGAFLASEYVEYREVRAAERAGYDEFRAGLDAEIAAARAGRGPAIADPDDAPTETDAADSPAADPDDAPMTVAELEALQAETADWRPTSFFGYTKEKAEAISFTSTRRGTRSTAEPQPLGKLGWGVYLLGAAGFVGGGVIAPLALSGKPYCARCQRYMRTKTVATIPASVPVRKTPKGDEAAAAAYDAEQDAAAAEAGARLDRAATLLVAGETDAGLRELGTADEHKLARKLPARIEVKIVGCPGCGRGELRPAQVVGQGEATVTTLLPPTELEPSVAKRLLA